MKTNFIKTYTGKKFYPLDLNPGDICIEDISHSLSNQCRFSGHTKDFYSVAEHSILVCNEVQKIDGDAAIFALLHDASEAYLVDLPRPLKASDMGKLYLQYERSLQQAIYRILVGRLPLQHEEELIKYWDNVLLFTEGNQLMEGGTKDWDEDEEHPTLAQKIVCYSPSGAEKLFLDLYQSLPF